MKTLPRLCAFAALLLAAVPLASAQEEETEYLPVWYSTDPLPITPHVPSAEDYPEPEEEPHMMGLMGLSTQSEWASDPEIVSLAASLGNDALRIFNYVRNRIGFEQYYGMKKGAVLTLVEGSGNDADQCALLKALLVAAGYTDVKYVIRDQVVPVIGNDGKNMSDWMGISADPFPGQTFQQAYGTTSPFGSGPSEDQAKRLYVAYNYLNALGNGSVAHWVDFERMVFKRVWLELTTGGNSYRLDPSFKRYQRLAPETLATLAGYTRNDILAAANKTSPATVAQSDRVQHLNKPGLTTYLNNRVTALLTELREEYPEATVEQIMGGRVIIPLEAASLSECFPLGENYNPFEPVPTPVNDFPDATMVKVRYLSGNIDYTIPSAELGDSRVSLTFSSNSVKLWVEDTEVDNTNVSASNFDLSITITHPGNLGSHSETKNYKKQNTYAYALIRGFSPSGKSLHRRYEILNGYLDSGLANDSRQVRTELLNLMGLTWLYQVGLVEKLQANYNNALFTNAHRCGRVGQEAGFYIDVGLAKGGVIAHDASTAPRLSSFHGMALFASAMEHGIIEQMQPGYSAVSTVNILSKANDAGQIIYRPNSLSEWNSIKGSLQNYSTATKNAIEAKFNESKVAMLPRNANVAYGDWTGTGYIVYGQAEAGMIISGGYGGGYSTSSGYVAPAPVYTSSSYNPVYSYSAPSMPSSSYNPPSYSAPSLFASDPVDMATGAFTYASTDLETGIEGAPRGLRFARYYTSNSRGKNTQNLGYGWTHDLYIRAEERTASEEGLGEGSPAQAARTLVAVMAVNDLYRNGATPKEWLTAAISAGWAVDSLTNNAVSVVIGHQVIQFIKRPDGSFEPPPGSTMTLQTSGDTYILKQRHGNTIAFDRVDYEVDNEDFTIHRAHTIADPDGKLLSFTYGTSGHNRQRIASIQDANARTYTFNYSGSGLESLLTSITDSTSRSVSFGYTGENLATYTDPESKIERYDYALTGDPTGQADLHLIRRVRNGKDETVVESDFDDLHRVGTQRLHGDPNKTFTLHYTGYANTETNPEGGVTTFFYDARGRSEGTEDPDGNRISWTYDGQDRIKTKTTAEGETTTYHYDEAHNLEQIDHPRGGGSTFLVYDSLDRIDLVTDPNGHQTDYVYNGGNTKDRPDQVIDPEGTTTFEYKTSGAAQGKIWKVTDDDNLLTEYEYDSRGHPLWVKAPGGFQTSFVYSARGDLTSTTDPRTIVTGYLYNARRQVTKMTSDQGGANVAVEDYTYDDAGNASTITAPEDNGGQRFKVRQEFSPTRKVRFTRTSDEDGEGANDPTTEIQYDSRDWQELVIDPLARQTSFISHPDGLLHQTVAPLSRTSTKVPDGDGRPSVITVPGSPGNRTSSFAYGVSDTGAGDQTSGYPKTVTTTPDALSVTVEEDRGGNTRFYTNRKGDTWEFQYDGLGRRTRSITPLDAANSRAHVTAYNHRGAPTTITEPSGQSANFAYNGTTGRLSSSTDGVGTITYTSYDNNGNLLSSTENRGGGDKVTTQTFDSQNRVTSRTDENGQTIGYRYYPSGKLAKIIYPGGSESGTGHVEYTWWRDGQLKEVIDKLDSTTIPRTTTYTWNQDGRLAKIQRPNGTVREVKYDSAGRPIIVEEYGPGMKLIFVQKLGFYPSDAMAWRYQLPSALIGKQTVSPTKAMTHNADNQIATWDSLPVTHDADGNMTFGPAPSGDTFETYGYDSRNRLNSALGYTYTYDANNLRLGMSGPGDSTSFVVDANSALSKVLVRTKNGVTTRYVWGLGLQYEVDASGDTISYHYDLTGSTTALTDDAAQVVERIAYTPYGQASHRVNVTGTLHDTPFLFTGFFGNQTDPNGLHYMRARYYHPRLARFLNTDPAQVGWNWYAYAAGNPVGMVDPTGLGEFSALDAVQTTLSFLGMIPVVGAVFDIANGFISLARGNYFDAAVNFASAVPGIGDAVGAVKIGSAAVTTGAAAYGTYRAVAGSTRSVSAASTGAAFNGALYSERKLQQLVPYLNKRGVDVFETTGNARFVARSDGTGTMYLPTNPTALQVKHELSHFLDFRALGYDAYAGLGRANREASVLHRLHNNRIWNGLNNAERQFSIQYPASIAQ